MDMPYDPPKPSRRLLVISPTKNEEAYLEATIRSLVAQNLRPTRWVIVNDGSTDGTGTLADAAAAQHDWIQVLHRPTGVGRRVGPGVIDAFYAGLNTVELANYDYLCKLDADLEVPPQYFAELLRRFEADPRLGTASGKVYLVKDGRRIYERTSDEFSIGAAKLYRRQCFEEIGGFVHEVMWDGIDCHQCRMRGWKAVSYPEEALALHHPRPMGSSHLSIYHGRRRWGRGQYFMGTHPLYLLGIAAYRMAERPWILGGANILLGYLAASLRRDPRYTDANPDFRRFLHQWQLAELKRRIHG